MKISKLLLAAAGATVLLGALVASASARNFSVSNQSIRSSWREVIFEGPFGTTNCQVTLEGSLAERTIVKRIGTLIGRITSALLGPCSAGTSTILTATLPWHVRYSGFEPRLPEIRSIIFHVIGSAFRVRETNGVTCLAVSEENHPAIGRFHREPRTHQLFGASIGGTLPTGIECFGAEGSFRSSEGSVSQVGGTNTLIFLSLI